MFRRAVALSSLLLALLGAGAARAGDLEVHFLDVGQGDAVLIVSPTGKTVLIDAGPPDAAGRLSRRLRKLVHAPLDLVILTHPHADHVGGMRRAIEAVGGANLFLDSGFDHGSPLYEHLLRTLEARKIPVRLARAGRAIDLGGGASLRLLAPWDPPITGTRSDVNANGVVARLTFGKTAFYFSGDAELDTERRILASGESVRSDVYKVAHHGSRFTSGAALLTHVQPATAVISVGAGNPYGHPASQTVARLERYGARVYRTDLDGEVTAVSDGAAVRVTTERSPGEPGAQRPGRKRIRERRLRDPPGPLLERDAATPRAAVPEAAGGAGFALGPAAQVGRAPPPAR